MHCNINAIEYNTKNNLKWTNILKNAIYLICITQLLSIMKNQK